MRSDAPPDPILRPTSQPDKSKSAEKDMAKYALLSDPIDFRGCGTWKGNWSEESSRKDKYCGEGTHVGE